MSATKVTLREKKITQGRKSLYLDFYPPIINPETGKSTRREYLGLYILERPRTEPDKMTNRETKALAEQIRAKRQLEIQAENFGFMEVKKRNADFVAFFFEMANSRTGSNKQNWQSCFKYFEDYSGGVCRMKDLNEQYCLRFLEYLRKAPTQRSQAKTLSENSVYSYFNKFKAAVRQAYDQNLLKNNPCKRMVLKQPEVEREILSLEELNLLVKTECDPPILKKAALFSAMTGMRWGDLADLVWKQIQGGEKNGYYISFRQNKTGGVETLPISKQVIDLIGERKNPSDKVFHGLKYSAWNNLKLKQWVMRAGISRDITFHCFRHTFATLQLTLGTDIYTVSKMLGHRDLKTTQIYAKVVDKKKQEAAERIQLDW